VIYDPEMGLYTYARHVADQAGFKGQLLNGNWILRVTDLEQRDVGRLNKWGMEFIFLE